MFGNIKKKKVILSFPETLGFTAHFSEILSAGYSCCLPLELWTLSTLEKSHLFLELVIYEISGMKSA